jgi:hypothetical protein
LLSRGSTTTLARREERRRGEERSCEIANNTLRNCVCRAEERRGDETRRDERSGEFANNTCGIACVLCAERRGEERRDRVKSDPIRYRHGEEVVAGDLEIAGSGGEGRGDGEQEL